MSSHHFVRDKQEPALIIANGAACSAELLGQLLEWNPFVMVLDGALDRVLELGIRIDALLGDMDSAEHYKEKTAHLQGLKILYRPDQEWTDLQKGIAYLIEEGYAAANILWATGRRADHTFNNMATLPMFEGRIQLSILDDHSRVYLLPKTFKKYYPAGTFISLLPSGIATGVQTSNLRYALSGESLELPLKTGSSNQVLADGFVEISYESGYLLMMECYD
jgi:thiamine pyrophosphokinase